MTEFGFELDSRTVFHILDTMAVLTTVDVRVEGEVFSTCLSCESFS